LTTLGRSRMNLALEVALIVVAALALVAVALRLRKLRRDEMRKIANRVERRLVEPPPSPYTPSKGFRLLDGPLNSPARPEPPRPRLEPDHEYVFSERQFATYQESVSPLGRRDERWALSKSTNRSRFSSIGARFAMILLVVLVVGIIASTTFSTDAIPVPPRPPPRRPRWRCRAVRSRRTHRRCVAGHLGGDVNGR